MQERGFFMENNQEQELDLNQLMKVRRDKLENLKVIYQTWSDMTAKEKILMK